MGLADRFRKVMGIPEPIDPRALRQRAFDEACAAHDEIAALENALAFSQDQQFDTALAAFERLEQVFPDRRAEWLRWQGQTLYIGMSWRAQDAAERIGCYQRALERYFAAAELGDRTQEFNVVELCEALAGEPVAPEVKRAACDRYFELFPSGEGKKRVEALLDP